MGAVVDHLCADVRVTVLQAFTDARGIAVQAGETGILRQIAVDWSGQTLNLTWERNATQQTLTFLLKATDGPRNGHMRQYFEVGEYVPLPRPKPAPPPAPEVEEEMIRFGPPGQPSKLTAEPDRRISILPGDERYLAAVRRIWALGARKRFQEAEAQMSEVLRWPSPYGAVLDDLVDELARLTAAHVHDPDEAVYQWFRQQTVGLLYQWGSCATSGGEGAVRAMRIRKVETDLEELDRKRKRHEG